MKQQVEAFSEETSLQLSAPDSASTASGPFTNQPQLLPENHKLRKSVELKLADGDVSGAVRLLSSRASLTPYNDESVDALQQRHPSPPENLQLPPSSDFSTPGLEVCAAVIEKSIRSFNPGSAVGPDRLSPQHLKELISKQTGEAGAQLLDALAALSNTTLVGAIPDSVCPVLYEANLE